MEEKLKYKKHHIDARIDMPARIGDVGYDVYSPEEYIVFGNSSVSVSLDLSFTIPEGYYLVVETRSGHGVKHNLQVHHGVIDQKYHGVVIIQVYNHSKSTYCIKKGEKIAQLILHKSNVIPLEECYEHPESDRGNRGFGSTNQ